MILVEKISVARKEIADFISIIVSKRLFRSAPTVFQRLKLFIQMVHLVSRHIEFRNGKLSF